jgi:hypothetical protein
MSQRFLIATGFCFFAFWAAAKEPQKTWLPPSFNGWQTVQGTAKSGADPKAVDAADSAVLTEYGFSDYESAKYSRNGRSMQVKAARFNDASGALGAFSFYMQPQMRKEEIGDRAVSNNSRILFYRGNILVDVTLETVSAMSAADLRALAEALPRPRGENSVPPGLPGYLPSQSLVSNTDRYIEGPQAFERLGAPIPAALVDFSKSRDVELARYQNRNGEATLILVEYPTPQIAAERLRAWQAASLPGAPFYFRRSGPLLAAVNGYLDENEAQSLLASINYDADVTWNQPARPDRNQDRYGFIVALVLLVVIILGLALIIGMMFGGLRVWSKKLLRGRAAEAPDEVEFIRLNLK